MEQQTAGSGARLARRITVAGGALAGGYIAWRTLERARTRRRNEGLLRGRHVVILGAGFAGTHVARQLSEMLPRDEDARITLVDQHDFLLFTPMLSEVVGAELEARHIAVPLHTLSPRVRIEVGHVERIDLATRRVTLRSPSHAQSAQADTPTITADHLVIALGSDSNDHGIPGVAEHSLTVKTFDDAVAIRNRADRLLQRAAAEADHASRRALLTVVVGGGGYTGVETMAALNDLLRQRVGAYPQLDPTWLRMVLVESGDRLLPELSEDLAQYAHRKLQARGVEVKLGTRISGASSEQVELEGSQPIPTRTLIWAGGIAAGPVVRDLECKHGRDGRIAVDATCAVPGFPGVWALGDCAAIPRQTSASPYAATAQNATREGSLVARNIVAVLRGGEPERFEYSPIGELALVGKHSGVASIYGLHFSGILAWAIWRATYLVEMPSAAQRARILFDWLRDVVFGRVPAGAQSVSSSAV